MVLMIHFHCDPRLRNELYCVEWDVKLYYTIPLWSAVRFLTRTFRNVLYVRIGKFIVPLWRSQCSQTVVWGGSRWDGSWKTPPLALGGRSNAYCHRWRRGHATPVRKSNPNLNQRPPRAVICLKLDNSYCYARYSCGNNCNVVVKLVQDYHCFLMHFSSVLQFAANDMFLREANSYKRALALRNSWLFVVHCIASVIIVPMSTQSWWILSNHFFLGRPTGRVPWTLPCRRTYGYLSGPILDTCPKYRNRRSCSNAVISFFISRSFFTSILRIRSCLVMPQILGSTAISKTQFPFMFLL